MRLKEESTVMILEIIGLVIILATIVFDVANNVLDQRQSAITNKALYATNLAIQSVESIQESFIDTFKRLYQLQTIVPEHQKGEKYESPEFKQLVEEFHKGKKTNNEFLEKTIQIYSDQAVNLSTQYNIQIDELQKLSEDKMLFWQNLKMFSNDIRIFAVILGMILYLRLYISIKGRTK